MNVTGGRSSFLDAGHTLNWYEPFLHSISFHDQDLHDTCANLEAAEEHYGIHAQAIVTFISDALAFENAEELSAFYGDGAKIASDDSLSIEISSRYSVTLVPVGKRFETDGDERVIWATVKRLKIMTFTGTR